MSMFVVRKLYVRYTSFNTVMLPIDRRFDGHAATRFLTHTPQSYEPSVTLSVTI